METGNSTPQALRNGDAGLAQERELASSLRRLRRSAGLSQQQMARALGLASHSSIAYYETCRRVPPADIVVAYERALDCESGSLQRLRLEALSARAEYDELAVRRAAETELPTEPSTEPQAAMPATPKADAAEVAPVRRLLGSRGSRRASRAALGLAMAVLATASASAAQLPPTRAALDPTWTQSTQNVTNRVEPAAVPEAMDGDDPRARDCFADAVVVQAVPLPGPGGGTFGTLRLRHSAHCGASWGSAYYSNPDLDTIRITVHRPADSALVRDDWSNDTPPGSYSDMLSTQAGCVWVEAEVITPTKTSASAKTGCDR